SRDLQPPAPAVEARPEPNTPAVSEPEASSPVASIGLPPDEIRQMVREAIEKVVWEVVPELAETIIREEIRRLTAPEDK
ncbi:MAG: hypothetical protein AAF449_23860, partial [Myxococcota bacterium]